MSNNKEHGRHFTLGYAIQSARITSLDTIEAINRINEVNQHDPAAAVQVALKALTKIMNDSHDTLRVYKENCG